MANGSTSGGSSGSATQAGRGRRSRKTRRGHMGDQGADLSRTPAGSCAGCARAFAGISSWCQQDLAKVGPAPDNFFHHRHPFRKRFCLSTGGCQRAYSDKSRRQSLRETATLSSGLSSGCFCSAAIRTRHHGCSSSSINNCGDRKRGCMMFVKLVETDPNDLLDLFLLAGR